MATIVMSKWTTNIMTFLLPAIAFGISIGYIIHPGQDVSGECFST
jgi:hypothetical protein